MHTYLHLKYSTTVLLYKLSVYECICRAIALSNSLGVDGAVDKAVGRFGGELKCEACRFLLVNVTDLLNNDQK